MKWINLPQSAIEKYGLVEALLQYINVTILIYTQNVFHLFL